LQEFSEEVRPRQLVSRDEEEIRSFVEDTGRTVIKPLYGAKGRNVFLIEGPDDPNLSQMVEAVLGDGYVIAQERIAGAENGDIRLFLIDGEPLQKDGRYAAFRRVPEGNDIRANISAGGHPKEVEIGDKILEMVDAMADRLRRDGMFFVGLDVIGDKVVEINAESAGGLQSAQHLTGVDFAPEVIKALEARQQQTATIRELPEPTETRSLRSV
jgi:glutathione synthase